MCSAVCTHTGLLIWASVVVIAVSSQAIACGMQWQPSLWQGLSGTAICLDHMPRAPRLTGVHHECLMFRIPKLINLCSGLLQPGHNGSCSRGGGMFSLSFMHGKCMSWLMGLAFDLAPASRVLALKLAAVPSLANVWAACLFWLSGAEMYNSFAICLGTRLLPSYYVLWNLCELVFYTFCSTLITCCTLY